MKKARLSEGAAITYSIYMWEWLAESGQDKYHKSFQPGHRELRKAFVDGYRYHIANDCWLCEYSKEASWLPLPWECNNCPYLKTFGFKCYAKNQPYYCWERGDNPRVSRLKKWAKEFLNDLYVVEARYYMEVEERGHLF